MSFASNTSWQSYAGETTLGYLSQMAGITVQSFLSAATGIPVGIALVRGFAAGAAIRSAISGCMTRALLYVLLPITVAATLFLVWQGVPQTLDGTVGVTTLEGGHQLIARGPVGSQVAIKMLSSDGGGFFNVNSAHPFENPTAATNLLEMLLIFAIGAGLTNTFGRMIGSERQGWALLAAMGMLYAVGVAAVFGHRSGRQPLRGGSRNRSDTQRVAGRGKHGREGGPLRYRDVIAIYHGDHRFFQRRGQRDA